MSTKVTLTLDSGQVITADVVIPTGKVTSTDILRSLEYTERLTRALEINPKAAAAALNAYTSGRTEAAVASAQAAGILDAETAKSPQAAMLQIINHLIVQRGRTGTGARIGVRFASGQTVEAENLPITPGAFSAEAIAQAVPDMRRMTSSLRADPQTAAELVNGYATGRMDDARTAAQRLGMIGEQDDAEPEGIGLVILILIIIIVIILLFPRSVS